MPKKPTNELEGYVQAQLGNYSDQEYEGALNVPLIGDRLLVRAAFKHVERKGFTRDVGPAAFGFSDVCVPSAFGCFGPRGAGFAGKDYDDKNYWHGRVGITFRPSERVENYLLGYAGKSHDNGTGFVIDGINPGFPVAPGVSIAPNVATISANLAYLCPQNPLLCFNDPTGMALLNPAIAQQVLARQQQLGPRRVAMNMDQFTRLEAWGMIDTFSFQLSDTLTLRNIVSYQRMKQDYVWDLDGSILPALSQMLSVVEPGNPFGTVGEQASITDSSQVTEELQFQGDTLDGKLSFVFGGYYSNSKPEGLEATGSFNGAQLDLSGFRDIENRSVAAYSQSTLDLGVLTPALEKLSFTAGLRYTKDRITGSRYASSYHAIPLVMGLEREYSATTWTAGLDYQASDDVLLYGKATRGYKAGGFNYAAPRPSALTYKPEFVTSYELGAKTDFRLGAMPARFNINAYYLDYEDLQRTAGDNYPNVRGDGSCPNTTCLDQGAIIFNAKGARIQGVEIETTIQPTKNLHLSLGYAWTNAKYTDYMLAVSPDPLVRRIDSCQGPVAVPFPGQPATAIDLSCAPFQNTPENMFNVNARYTLPLGEAGLLAFGAAYAWIDKVWHGATMTPNDDPLGWTDSYGLLNLSIAWSGIFGSKLDARIWGTNVTDETYRSFAYTGYSTSTGFVNSVYGEPRMYGLSLRYSFGK
ncbi:MAG: TonB-dependent receptor [Gammaproteobacteria bacterium]|nr:TonB-dependent receptor [Gammaproteobacteria bacterium]